ncbi:MAG: DEAD/DEAH box helicase [bacterium]|nr:DEAD/DEAH box helicase [bacterium]
MARGHDSEARARQARSRLIASIQESIAEHGSHLAGRGRKYVTRVTHFDWNVELQQLTCRVRGSAVEPYEIEIDLPFSRDGSILVTCSCPYGEGRQIFCKHTWAALTQLVKLLESRRNSPLTEQLVRLEPQPEWTRAIAVLDSFLADEDQAAAESSQPQVQVRLTWRVKAYPGGLQLGAYEQRIAKSGGWTGGRKVGWERLSDTPALWTNAADREAVAAIHHQKSKSYYGYYPQLTWMIDVFAALVALVGHPHVFWADDPTVGVSIEGGELGLVVKTVGGMLALDAALDGRPLSEIKPDELRQDPRGLIRVDAGSNRIVAVASDERAVELAQAITKKQILVPREGHEELLARLARLERVLPVTLPGKLLGGTVEPDARIFLLLTPAESSGLVAEVRVRPAPEGSTCAPGEGPAELTGFHDGKRVVVERTLDDELRAARAVTGELGLERHIEERPWRWVIVDDDDALDLIAAAARRAGDDLVVEWPEGESMSIAGELTPAALRVEIEDRHDWFGLNGFIDVDGRRIPLLDLLRGLRHAQRYLPIGDGRWARIAESFRDRLAALDDVVHVRHQRLEVDATAAPVVTDLLARAIADAGVSVKACRRWTQLVERLDEAVELDPDPPVTLTAELRPYQVEGYRWLRRLACWGVGGCLADDMGLGKTVQTLAVLIDRVATGPALVVAPTSVGFIWIREAERFAPTLRLILYRNVVGETDRHQLLSELGDGDVVVTSYGLVLRDVDKLAEIRWGTLVLDEAQFIKNSETKTAQATRRIDADWRLALTGTPLENHLGELWSLFRSISPGLFGSRDRFRKRFAAPIEKKRDLERRHGLSRVVRPFILRRTKSEVLDELPGRTEVQRIVELSEAERKLYEDTRLRALVHLAGLVDDEGDHRFQVLAALTRLRQLACHPKLVDASWTRGSAKMALLLETVEELREGRHRALVFSQFTQHLALVREALDKRGSSYQYLDGKTPAKERVRRVDAFQRGEGDLFLISLKAGGTGLNLTAADYVLHLDPWWNPAVEDQATDRAHRIGQTRPVTVYRLVAKDTIEEQILRLHADKRDLVAGVLEGSDQAAKLSAAELVALIRCGGQQQTS